MRLVRPLAYTTANNQEPDKRHSKMQLKDSKDHIQSDSAFTHRGQYNYNESYFSVTILSCLRAQSLNLSLGALVLPDVNF